MRNAAIDKNVGNKTDQKCKQWTGYNQSKWKLRTLLNTILNSDEN